MMKVLQIAIPSNQADFVALVIARDDYQTRKERDDANAYIGAYK